MQVTIYPKDDEPFKIFTDNPWDCTILISDRESGTCSIRVQTHLAGLESLKQTLDKKIEELKNREIKNV